MSQNVAADQIRTGRVIANYGAALTVESDDRVLHRCIARRKLGLVVCGDYVEWMPQARGDAVVTKVMPRTTSLERLDRRSQLKPLASNFDQIIITGAVQPPIDLFLVDRYLIFAEHIGAEVVVVVNKIDLLSSANKKLIEDITKTYQKIGYRSITTCTKSTDGMNELLPFLQDKTSIFVGQSGAGKSSLIQKLVPDREIRTGELSAASGLGSHTTTTTILYHIPSGGELIDSPGVREFHISQLEETEITNGFIEFKALAGQCKFNNCSHRNEPNCAVKEQLEAGEINPVRYKNYLKMLDE